MRRFLPHWPRMLIVAVVAIAASSALDLASHGVAVTGDVPTGPPSLALPDVPWSEAATLFAGALSIVFVGYSESLASARAMARKHGYEIDTDQELIAQGAASGAAGFVGARQPRRLALLRGCGAGDPVPRHHAGDPDRRRAVAAAHRAVVADLHPPARA